MAIAIFDETKYEHSFDFYEYFKVMDIPEEDRQKRVKLAENFRRVLLFFFASLSEEYGKEYYYIMLEERCKAIAEGYLDKSDLAYINEWARRFSIKTVDETFEKIENPVSDDEMFHFEEWDIDIPKNEYWTSDLRTMLIAGGLAVLIAGYDELIEAVESGKTYKTWNTEKDKRVRQTHREAEKQTVEIWKPFTVGGWELLLPGDDSLGAPPEETSNCRCHLTYS